MKVAFYLLRMGTSCIPDRIVSNLLLQSEGVRVYKSASIRHNAAMMAVLCRTKISAAGGLARDRAVPARAR